MIREEAQREGFFDLVLTVCIQDLYWGLTWDVGEGMRRGVQGAEILSFLSVIMKIITLNGILGTL